MNIDPLSDKKNKAKGVFDSLFERTGNIKAYSFKYDLANEREFAEFLKPQENEQIQQIDLQAENLDELENAANSDLLKKLKELAINDPVKFNITDLHDPRLLLYAKDLFNLKEELKFDLGSLTQNDISFLKQSLDNPGMILNSLNQQQNYQINFSVPDQSGQISYKSLNFSKGLYNLIEYAQKSQKPIRLDFEGDSSVILRIDNKGKLSAEFLSNDKAMEYLLKSNLQNLRNKFDSEGIPYKELVYKDNQDKGNRKKQYRNEDKGE